MIQLDLHIVHSQTMMFDTLLLTVTYSHSKLYGTHRTLFKIHENSKLEIQILFFPDSVQPFSRYCVVLLHPNWRSPQKYNSLCTIDYCLMNHKPLCPQYPINAWILCPVPWLRSRNRRGFIGETTIADKDRLARAYCWRTCCGWFPLYAHEKDGNHHNCLFLI